MDLTQFQPDRESAQPVFRQLADFIRGSIDSGTLMPGERLPTERAFSEQLGLARGTVRSAFQLLERDGVLVSRRGSGSYVAEVPSDRAKNNRETAARTVRSAIGVMEELGMSPDEMASLFHYCLAAGHAERTVSIAIVGRSQEALLDMKRQLGYLENVSASVFILESITTTPDPRRFFGGYDLVITTGSCYGAVAELIPGDEGKVIEAALAPSRETLQEIFSLKKDARIGIICRTNAFLGTVKDTLLTYGFDEKNIQSFFEMDYTTTTYFPGGIDALISFSDAHIFTEEGFKFRNEELLAKGGKLIRFVSNLERGSVIYIEDRVKAVLN